MRNDGDYIKYCLERKTGKTILLAITDNSTSMLSIKIGKEAACVRLHKMFLDAGTDVIDQVAELIKSRKGQRSLIKRFIKQHVNTVKKKPYRNRGTQSEGNHHNLHAIANEVNKEYFEGHVSSSIMWGKKSQGCTVSKRTLGSYNNHTDIIRINPVLDKKNVPRFFLEFVIYHEMLHADMGIDTENNRRNLHSREFRKRERSFKEYEKAIVYEKGKTIW